MAQRNILFVTTAFPTLDDSVRGTFILEHARAAQTRNQVAVLHCAGVLSGSGPLWQMQREANASLTANIPTYRVRYRRSPIPFTSYALFVLSVERAARALSQNGFRPDLIHAHYYDAAPPALAVARRWRVPLVVTAHASKFPDRTLSRRELVRTHVAFALANRVLPVSEHLRRAISAYGIRAKITVVPNVVDHEIFNNRGERGEEGRDTNDERSDRRCDRPLHESGRIIFVGSLEETHNKGVPILLDALASLSKGQSWHLDIVGMGPTRGVYEDQAARLGLSERVAFHGAQSKLQIAELMRRASFLVLPSRQENLPCVVLEALSCGLPVVCTDVGGIPEIVDASRGVLISERSPGALCGAIDQMLNRADTFDRNRLSRFAQEHFGLGVVGQKLDAVYSTLLLS